jgi:hypothetical protein
MNPKTPEFWFPAKRYGWGWGPPVCWQGWLVVLIYCASILAAVRLFIPAQDVGGFVLSSILLTVVFVAVLAWKGEKPSWRWGGK